MSSRLRPLTVLVVACAIVLGGPTLAWAAFSRTISAAATYSSATLQPPTNFNGSKNCQGANSTVSLTWTATTSTFATGYQIRYTRNGAPLTSDVSGATTTSTTIAIDKGANYVFKAASVAGNWESVLTAPTGTIKC